MDTITPPTDAPDCDATTPPRTRFGGLVVPWDEPPAVGTTREVAPGVHWVRLPLPIALDHINVWLLEDGDGWWIIDCGMATAALRAVWNQVFDSGVLGGRPVTAVLATHFHPDHIGNAGWLVQERWPGARFLTSRTEWLLARLFSLPQPESTRAQVRAHFTRMGLPEAELDRMDRESGGFERAVLPLPDRFEAVHEGDRLTIGGRDWHVHVGRGHAPEHLVLHAPGDDLLICGDMALPRITPNVSVFPHAPEEDSVTLFTRTLLQLGSALAEHDPLVLPAHVLPYRGLHRRIAALVAHHEERLQELRDGCRDRPLTTAQTCGFLFRRKLDGQQMVFALGEAQAHINHLVKRGELSVTDGPDGLRRYQTIS